MSVVDDFWKIFNVIKGDTVEDINEVLSSIAQSEKGVSTNLFTNTLDQPVFSTADYRRLRNFLIDWYASLRTVSTVQTKISDPYSIPNDQLDELFRSFGFPYSSGPSPLLISRYEVNPTKVELFLDLVNLYKIKGTPRAIIEILTFFGLANVDLYEFWLEKSSASELIFRGKLTGSTTTTQFTNDYILPYNELTEIDPHWFYSESQILTLDTANKINLPSKTPYFALRQAYDISEIEIMISIISRLVQDQYQEYVSTGSIASRNIYISTYGQRTSLLELYLSCVYVYNRLYSTGSNANRFICYDGTNSITITGPFDDIMSEHSSILSLPSSRSNLESRLTEYYDTFTRLKTTDFLQNSTDAGTYLNTINSTLYDFLNDKFIPEDVSLVVSLLADLGGWVKTAISSSYPGISFFMFGLAGYFENLNNIINFFKPYRARWIHSELLYFNNPLDAIRMNDTFGFDVEFEKFIDFAHADGSRLYNGDLENCQIECIDSTSVLCTGNPRDTYDCGGFYDVGIVDDNIDIYLIDSTSYTIIWNEFDKSGNISLSNFDLTLETTGGVGSQNVRATEGLDSGKWYWEVLLDILNGDLYTQDTGVMTSAGGKWTYIGADAFGWGYRTDGETRHNNVAVPAYGDTWTENDIIGIALDMDTGKIWFSKNGVWQNSGDPEAGTGFAYDNVAGTVYPAYGIFAGLTLPFGQATATFFDIDLEYDIPNGFSSLAEAEIEYTTISDAIVEPISEAIWNEDDKSSRLDIIVDTSNLGIRRNGAGGWGAGRATVGVSKYKWYWEYYCNIGNVNQICIGISDNSHTLETWIGDESTGWCYFADGTKGNDGGFVGYGDAFAINTIMGIALDMDNGMVWFSKNGIWQAVSAQTDPEFGLNPAFPGISGTIYPAMSANSDVTFPGVTAIFSPPFTYPVPNGYNLNGY